MRTIQPSAAPFFAPDASTTSATGPDPVGVGYDCVMEGLSAVRWALDELPPDTPIVVVSAYGPERSLPGIAAIGARTTRPPR